MAIEIGVFTLSMGLLGEVLSGRGVMLLCRVVFFNNMFTCTYSGGMPARSTAPLIATAPSWGALMEASWPPKLRKREDERDDKGRKSSMRRNSNIDEIASSRGVADSGATWSALLRQ